MEKMSHQLLSRGTLGNLSQNSMTYKELVIFAKAHNNSKMQNSEIGRNILSYKTFELDLNEAKIRWIVNGKVSVSIKCQIVGTRTRDGQFMWAWGHPSVPAKSRIAAEKVQIYASQHKLIDLMERRVVISQSFTNDFSNITAFLNDADGTWMGNYGDGEVYLIYYENSKVDKE
jgi:hypothetical protein